MDEALRAIAEPNRRAILRMISAHEMSAGAIAARFDVTRPAISQHLRVLEDVGLVIVRKSGTHRYYRTRADRLAELKAYLDDFWRDNLSRLKSAAEAEFQQRGEDDGDHS